MKQRQYGRTAKQISVLGFGGMRFDNINDTDACVETMLYAHERGINYFDTAPAYFGDKSETVFGLAIEEMKKRENPFYISTKSAAKTSDGIRLDLETSLRRLRVETIDFYHCWCLMTPEDWQSRKANGVVEALQKAKEEGLVRHVTVSTHLPGEEIRKVAEEGIFEGVTLGYSAINFPYREEGVRAAGEQSMGVVIMNPLGGGQIPRTEETFSFIKQSPEQPIVEAALQFLLSHTEITSCLVGFRNKADVDSAVEAVENGTVLTPEHIEAMRARLSSDCNSLCTTCGYCDVCPEGIDVWMFMETANLLTLKTNETVKDRLYWHWSKDISELDRCISCGDCEAACTQKLPILDRFEELKEAMKK